MNTPRISTVVLASVRSADEAVLCVEAGPDLIDCKEPLGGALGALPYDVVAAIRQAVPRDIPVSATIGDLIPEPAAITAAVTAMSATGVDYVKIGIFPGGDARAAIETLAPLAGQRFQMVGLLLADCEPDFSLIQVMAHAGFAGVMIDTADKASGSLPSVMTPQGMSCFIETAHGAKLFAGLAGSLRLAHIASLLGLSPDLLGFRGALCRAGDRRGELDRASVEAVREAIPRGSRTAGTANPSRRQEVV